MSDGDGRSSLKFLREGDSQQSKKRKKKSGADEFTQAIARVAVAQVCESLGFQSFQQYALDTLADVGVRYIREIGRAASLYANLANRSQCNVFDLIQGLEDLCFIQGFSGASDLSHSLSGSGVIKGIMSYVGQADEIQFAYLTPVFPVVKERTLNRSFSQVEENPPDEHIPSWLPEFPDLHTYTDLSSKNEKNLEVETVEKKQPVDEKLVLNFWQNLVCNGFKSGVVDHGDASSSQRAEQSNPFLAPPLQYGEKEVSVPALSCKFLDDTADYNKSIEAFQVNLVSSEPTARPHFTVGSSSCEPGDMAEILLNGRPRIQLKFGNSKRPLRLMTDPQSDCSEKVSVWFADDCEAKRRVDKLFREDAEFQQEMPQL